MLDNLAHAAEYAQNLSCLLMTYILLVMIDWQYCVLPSEEYDGSFEAVIHEYDPFVLSQE